MNATVIAVDSAINGEITVSFREDILDEPVVVSLGAEQIIGLLSQLTNHAAYALTWAAKSLVAGDCGTCLNVGLVTVKNRHGRDQQVDCPDCHEKRGGRGFPEYPRIGGGVR